jgi:ComF family protein
VWIATDYAGIPKELIHKYKFEKQRVAASSITSLMIENFLDFNNPEQINWLNYLVVPVPTASSRVRERSFDHSILLAGKVAKSLKLETCTAVGRYGTARQLGATRSQRLKQAQESYYICKKSAVNNRNILLVDDVVTTGATLSAVTRILKGAGAKHVDALVFAKRR